MVNCGGGLGVGWDAVTYQFTSARGIIAKRGREQGSGGPDGIKGGTFLMRLSPTL